MQPPPYKNRRDELSPPEMDTSSDEPAPEDAEATEPDESAEQATVPASLLEGREVKPGDTVKFKVVSNDGDNVVIECMDDEKPDHRLATDKMAAEFD